MNSIKQTARTTGILYLVMFITAPIAILMVSSKLIVPDDAATTTANIVANEGLFRFSIAGHLVVVLLDLAISVLLYVILKPVNRILAMLAMASRLVMTAMRGINLVNYFIVLQLVNGVALTGTPDASHFQSLVMVYLNAFDSGFSLDLVFFALHLFLIGYPHDNRRQPSSWTPNKMGV